MKKLFYIFTLSIFMIAFASMASANSNNSRTENIRRLRIDNIQFIEDQKQNRLYSAIIFGEIDDIDAAIKNGGRLNEKYTLGINLPSPFFVALEVNRDISIVKHLINKGADYKLGGIGYSPLILAITNENMPLIDFWLSKGVDVNDKAPFFGFTPLMEAVLIGDIELVKRLVDMGADVSAVNSGGYSVLCLSNKNNQIKIANYLRLLNAPNICPK